MDKNRKVLKEYSIVILILAAISLVRMVVDVLVYGFTMPVPEDIDKKVMKTVAIIVFVIGLLLLLPNVFVGVRGLKEAKNPTDRTAHIVWAMILAILAVLSTVSAIRDITKGFTISKLLEVFDVALDAGIFFMYYFTAKKVSDGE